MVEPIIVYDDFQAMIDNVRARPLNDIIAEIIELHRCARATLARNKLAAEFSAENWLSRWGNE